MPRKPKPTTLAEARAAAGAAVGLSALDGACGNAALGGQSVGRFTRPPEVLAHPDFLPPLEAAALTSLNVTGPMVQARLEEWLLQA